MEHAMKSTIPALLALAVSSTPSAWAEIHNTDTGVSPSPAVAIKPSASQSSSPGNAKPSLVNQTEPRGKLLYENHCTGCHDSTAHIRAHHKVKTINDINHWVTRWSKDLSLKWKADEIEDVVNYLNREFYKLDAPVRD